MKCPIDNVDLVMSERSGIEVDYCPKCRGVWLDRGELDKIIERAVGESAPQQAQAAMPQSQQQDPRYDERARFSERGHGDDDGHGRRGRRGRRESWLGELFDF